MGNVPNKWVGRGIGVALALASAVVAYFVGAWIGRKLAYGFTFDWYVHPAQASYGLDVVLPNVAIAAALAALVSVALGVFPTVRVTTWLMKRERYAPPRYPDAVSSDVHFGRLALVALLAVPFLAVALAYTLLAWPLLSDTVADAVRQSLLQRPPTPASGSVIEQVRPDGFVQLVALANAGGALVGTLLANLTSFGGTLAGRIVVKGERNLIARASLFGMRNAKTTVALVLGLTMVAGYSASSITTNVDVADVLPRGDPNTEAAHNLTETFKSSFTQQVTFQFRVVDTANATQMELFRSENVNKLPNRTSSGKLDPDDPRSAVALPGGSVADASNITDELYVRAMTEMIEWVVTQEPFAGSVGAPDFFKLINWTIAGGNNASAEDFALPGTDPEGSLAYTRVEQGVLGLGATYNAVDAVTSPTWQQTAILVTVGSDYEGTTKHIGERALEVRQEWLERVERGETQYAIFGPDNPPQFTVDLPIANAHASELTSNDFKLLLPVIAVFIAVTLFIAFRNAVSVVATFAMLAIATIWTFGVMGALGIALNTLNLATVPLIMGVGIDYGIHMMNEYQELRAEGRTPEEAWTSAGGGSAFALFVGMLTTAAGLVVMIASPSLLVAQLGLLANIALLSCYLLAIVFIPAIVTLTGDGRGRASKDVSFQPSRLMPRFASGVSRARWGVALVLVLLAGAAFASGSSIRREAFGDPPRNWLESDPLRQEHERAVSGFYDSDESEKANVIVIQGDITDPAVHDYIKGITATLRAYNASGWTDEAGEARESRIIADTLKDLPFLVNTYLTVKDGIPGAGQFIAADALAQRFAENGFDDPSGQTQTYPQSREEMLAILDEVQDSPLYQFQNLFLSAPEYDMTVIVFSVKAATYEDAEAVWFEVQSAIAANDAIRPEGTQATFFGNTAINYLFVAKQVPWLGYMSIATNVLVGALVLVFTRNVRATLVVATLNFLTTTLWLGILPLFDIGLAISLTMPLVFIAAVGSDYGLHLALRCHRTKDTYGAFEGVGKGVLFSFVTVLGSFFIFTRISDLAGRRSMVATAIAITVCFVATLLIVPIFYPVKKEAARGRGGEPEPLVETRQVPVKDAQAATPAPVRHAPE